jgi:DUF1009 family protein/MoaA/NifB/PqqE/SkfB family radical SAM enzyme
VSPQLQKDGSSAEDAAASLDGVSPGAVEEKTVSCSSEILTMDFLEQPDGSCLPRLGGTLPTVLFENLVEEEYRRLSKHPPLIGIEGGTRYSLTFPQIPSAAASRGLLRPVLARLGQQAVPYWATLSLTDAARTRSFLRGIQGSTRPDVDNELSTEEWRRTIDQVMDLGVVNISFRGGEVFLREDVVELVEYIDKSRATVNLFTDGSCLDPAILPRLKDAGLNALVFQLQGSTPDQHDEAAQLPGLYEKVVQGIGEALGAGLLVGIITNSKKEDISSGGLEDRIRLARSLGVHQITIVDAIPTGFQLRQEEIILDKEERERVVALARRYNKEPDGARVVLEFFPTNGMGPVGPDEDMQLHVTSLGDVCPCDYTPLAFGNVRDSGIAPIWAEMSNHPAYGKPPELYRMQDVGFRRRYIDSLPADTTLPYYVGGKQKIGVIAGWGEFPLFFAREVKKFGYEVLAIGLEEEVSGRIGDYTDKVWTVGVGELSRVIELLKENDLREIVMVGKVHKSAMFGALQIDDRMKRLLGSLKIKDDASILKAIASEMEKEGIHIMEPNHFISSLLIRKGCLTKRQPTEREMADVKYGYEMAKKVAAMGIGQTIAVKDGAVLAVEAIEGTDKAITRASTLAHGNIVVVKVAAPDHDMRFDAPVIGEDTIQTLFTTDTRVLAVEADRTIILDREAVIKKADDRNITIVAL